VHARPVATEQPASARACHAALCLLRIGIKGGCELLLKLGHLGVGVGCGRGNEGGWVGVGCGIERTVVENREGEERQGNRQDVRKKGPVARSVSRPCRSFERSPGVVAHRSGRVHNGLVALSQAQAPRF